MFGVEMLFGVWAQSASLLADSLDFFGDVANYGISLWVLGMGYATRAKASQLKAATMQAFGVWVLLGVLVGGLWTGNLPDVILSMGSVALLALAANAAVAAMLYVYREGDSNMRSVWICSRNDAIGNVAVVLAAVGVFGTVSGLPDLIVAGVMATLALSGAWQMWRYAQQICAMQPLSDVFSRWSSGCLRCIAVLVYAAPMRKPIIHRLLPFLLACVLLAQTAVGVAGWHRC